MKILLVLATNKEAAIPMNMLSKYAAGENHYRVRDHAIDLLVTGSGMVQTTFAVTDALTKHDYGLAINLGICGTFKNNFKISEVVHVHKDRFADWGALEKDGFKDVFDMGLEEQNKKPFEDGWVYEQLHADVKKLVTVRTVEGLTINTIKEKELDTYHNRYDADVESMEGAAFFYACRMKNINCLQLRAISNIVGERDKSKWNIIAALNNLGEYFTNDFLSRI